MPTNQQLLQTALDQAEARLAELDAMSIDQQVRGTFTVSGVTVDWNAYRAALMQQIKDLTTPVDGATPIQRAGGPFEVYG